MEKIYKDIPDNQFEFHKPDFSQIEVINTPVYSYWRSVFRKFFSSKMSYVILAMMTFVVLISFIQPLFSNYSLIDTTKINDFAIRYQPPSLKYWFGTDANGQSLFDAVWAGARTTISMGVLATLLTMIVGTIIGCIWGYSKKVDRVMIEVYNVFNSVPQTLIAMVLSYGIGSGFWKLLFVFVVTEWFNIAYDIRIQVIIRRDFDYNIASTTLGTKTWQIILKNILPFLVSVIVTRCATLLPAIISQEVFFSFIGVGLPPEMPSLGRIINQYSTNMINYPYLFWIPVFVLALVTITLYLVAQRLADASDPKTHY